MSDRQNPSFALVFVCGHNREPLIADIRRAISPIKTTSVKFAVDQEPPMTFNMKHAENGKAHN